MFFSEIIDQSIYLAYSYRNLYFFLFHSSPLFSDVFSLATGGFFVGYLWKWIFGWILNDCVHMRLKLSILIWLSSWISPTFWFLITAFDDWLCGYSHSHSELLQTSHSNAPSNAVMYIFFYQSKYFFLSTFPYLFVMIYAKNPILIIILKLVFYFSIIIIHYVYYKIFFLQIHIFKL
jgi:hypothetical protein